MSREVLEESVLRQLCYHSCPYNIGHYKPQNLSISATFLKHFRNSDAKSNGGMVTIRARARGHMARQGTSPFDQVFDGDTKVGGGVRQSFGASCAIHRWESISNYLNAITGEFLRSLFRQRPPLKIFVKQKIFDTY